MDWSGDEIATEEFWRTTSLVCLDWSEAATGVRQTFLDEGGDWSVRQ